MLTEGYQPAIVVVAYNRHESVNRLLTSLNHCEIPDGTTLIVSIDRSDNPKVAETARNYNYSKGEKIIIEREERMGLRKHVLSCGDLALKYGSIIMLEDDSYLAPQFYTYTKQALDFYDTSDKIGGISLYVYQINPLWELPFWHLSDDSDVYFVQRTSSLGQAWTKKQWADFKNWYDTSHETADMSNLPTRVSTWPETSWLKYHIKYLVDTDKYFVYPKAAFTTNFMDLGTHVKKIRYDYQTYMQFGYTNYKFKKVEDSYCLYDVYFELNTAKLKQLNPYFAEFDFCNDLYGFRSLNKIQNEYILTRKKIKNPIATFDRCLKPHEVNPILNMEGKGFYFGKKSDVYSSKWDNIQRFANDFEYFYRREFSDNNIKDYIKYKLLKKFGKIKS